MLPRFVLPESRQYPLHIFSETYLIMYIHNTTFMLRRSAAGIAAEWLGYEWLQHATESVACNPRLSRLVSAGDADIDPEATSIAFQVEFDSLSQAEKWAKGPLARIIDAFYCKFGPEAMTFSSVFETLSLAR